MYRLLGLLGGLSAAIDLGSGAALDESLTRCVVATRFAHALGCPQDEVAEVLYTALLQHVGCTAYAYEAGLVWGDDVAVTRYAVRTDFASAREVLREWVPGIAAASGRSRARVLATTLATARSFGAAAPVATCEVARAASRDLGLPDRVQRALGSVTASWDGTGVPHERGAAIPRSTRVVHVASAAVGTALYAGVPAALARLSRWSGSVLDPGLVAAFVADGSDLLDGVDELDAYQAVLDAEPDPVRRVPDSAVVDVAQTFGRIVDLKCPGTLGHSDAVAALAERAALALGLDDDAARLRLAGHLHDLGKVGVPSSVWARATAPTATEQEQARLHAYHGERVVGRVPELALVARLVGEHHERLDGSGYHRGLTAPYLSLASRVLAAADAYRARLEGRPGTPPEPPARAAAWMRAQAGGGRLDPDAVDAVLGGAARDKGGHRVRPSGLTRRQVEVLRLVARGLSNAEIARELVISRRTAEHHVQDVYARAGVSSRAGVAMYALRHGLVESPGTGAAPGDE
ncbi:HD domain-containing phosphohydrolase [Cellulosimicrobium sp. Marseille-Q4280]|uniref:HD domain-containing phosphohydrolase n=1 Tax=Cellulosimicrobium sp. Marseille-Q4280 TaxID=2937992 RepID=UPI00203CD554|nr:HD domain-containing phosphohydrolase [Cellulosimicrobium sp. Marseille-Q4280]